MIASGGPRNSRPGTLTQLFFDACEKFDKPDALQVKVGGSYQPISHRTLLERVRRVALGLHALGVQRGDRVAIISENRPEWAIADYACLTASLTDVTQWTDEAVGTAQKIRSATSAAEAKPLVDQLISQLNNIVNGVDANKDGNIGWQTGEGGLAQADAHMHLMMKGEGIM